MKISLVATTAAATDSLSAYAENARDYGYRDIELIVVADRGDASALHQFCESTSRRSISCRLLTIQAQRQLLLSNCPDLESSIRIDSKGSVHLGFLDAWLNGASVLIAIDAHHAPGKFDFVGAHLKAMKAERQFQIQAQSEWFNLARLVVERNKVPFVMRGYPFQDNEPSSLPPIGIHSGPVAVNAGIETGAADLSAATRIRSNVTVVDLKPEMPPNFTLPSGVWAPFASRNLAMWRDCVPAYFLTAYAGRYNDIWASYILTRIAHHLGKSISFGSPLLRVGEPSTDPHLDFEQELVGYRQSLRLSSALRTIQLSGTSFHECFGQIAAALPAAWPELAGFSGIEIEARNQLLTGLRQWHHLFATIAARSKANLFESIAQSSSNHPIAAEVSNFT